MMRGLFAIVISVAVIQIAAAAVECPKQNGPDVIIIANPEKCTSYYICNYGEPYLMECPEGLYFDPDLRVCDWAIRDEDNGCKIPGAPIATERPALPPTAAPVSM